MKKTFKAMLCQMCGNYSKTKSGIMKHYQKYHIIFFIIKCRSLNFKPLLEKAKPTSVDSSSLKTSDKPKAPLRNVGSQPLGKSNLWLGIIYQVGDWGFLSQIKLSRRTGYTGSDNNPAVSDSF